MCQGSRNRIEDIRYRPYVAWMLAKATTTAIEIAMVMAVLICYGGRQRDVPGAKEPIERKSGSRIVIDNPSILPKYVVQSGIRSSPHSKAADPDNMRIRGYC